MTRICFNFARKEQVKYISHLDMMRLFQRALRRSAVPLAYSEGFSPHPRFNLAAPLPVDVTADEELGEVYLTEEIAPQDFVFQLNKQLPEGLEIFEAKFLDKRAPALPAIVCAALYQTSLVTINPQLEVNIEDYRSALDRLLDKESILVQRSSKKGKKRSSINIRPFIKEADLINDGDGHQVVLKLLLQTGSQGGVSPVFVLDQLDLELGEKRPVHVSWNIHRAKLYQVCNGSLKPLSEGMCN